MASIFHRAIKKRIPFRESFPKDALWCRIRLTRVFLTMWLLPTLPIPFIWFRVYVCVYSSLFPLDIIVFGILETLVGPNLSSQVSTSYSASCITLFLPFDAVLSFVLPSPPRPPPLYSKFASTRCDYLESLERKMHRIRIYNELKVSLAQKCSHYVLRLYLPGTAHPISTWAWINAGGSCHSPSASSIAIKRTANNRIRPLNRKWRRRYVLYMAKLLSCICPFGVVGDSAEILCRSFQMLSKILWRARKPLTLPWLFYDFGLVLGCVLFLLFASFCSFLSFFHRLAAATVVAVVAVVAVVVIVVIVVIVVNVVVFFVVVIFPPLFSCWLDPVGAVGRVHQIKDQFNWVFGDTRDTRPVSTSATPQICWLDPSLSNPVQPFHIN